MAKEPKIDSAKLSKSTSNNHCSTHPASSIQSAYTVECSWQYRGIGLAILDVRLASWMKIGADMGERTV